MLVLDNHIIQFPSGANFECRRAPEVGLVQFDERCDKAFDFGTIESRLRVRIREIYNGQPRF